jgi:hypothetical protein
LPSYPAWRKILNQTILQLVVLLILCLIAMWFYKMSIIFLQRGDLLYSPDVLGSVRPPSGQTALRQHFALTTGSILFFTSRVMTAPLSVGGLPRGHIADLRILKDF